VPTITGSGDNTVNVSGAIASFEAATVSGIDELTITTANAGSTADFDSIAVGRIIVSADLDADAGGQEVVTVDADAVVDIRTNQSRTSIDADTATGSMTLVAGDVNGTATAVGTLTTGIVTTSQATTNSATTGTTGGTVTIEASDANVTMTGVNAWMQSIVITGDEDVTLSTSAGATSVGSAGIDGSASSGVITVNILDSVANTADTTSVTTGNGADSITINANDVVTVVANGGDDTIVVTDIAATSTLDASEGDDTFTMTEAATEYVAIGGAGDDTFNVGTNTGMQASIIGGEGDDDTLIVGNASLDLTAASANFTIAGVEVFELDATNGTMTMTATQFANNNTVKLEGDSATADLFVVEGLATANVIDASGVTVETTQGVGITYTGGAKNDTITGGAADETLAFGSAANAGGGSDTFDGGAGTDTFDGALVRGVTETGSAASVGAVINLGSTAVATAAVSSQLGEYISGSLTEVGAGQVAYTFATNATTNSTLTSTLVNIENITGTAGKDYLVGDAANNTITDGAGADYIVTGSGVDKVIAGSSVVLTAETVTEASLGATETITFGNGLDIVSDFVAGAGGDTIDTVATAVTAVGVDHTANTAAASYFFAGEYNATTGVFTGAAAGSDTLIFNGDANADLASIDTFTLLLDVTASDLVADNYV